MNVVGLAQSTTFPAESITGVMAVTGVRREEALSLLQRANGDVNRAVQIHFTN